eukprot:UN03094
MNKFKQNLSNQNQIQKHIIHHLNNLFQKHLLSSIMMLMVKIILN